MINYKMLLSYDGGGFNGWQKQGNTENTVQGRLETALEKLTGQPVRLQGAGRTDRGVHAAEQVASFCLESAWDCDFLRDSLNQALSGSVAIQSVKRAGPHFHARLNAGAKTYVYRLWDDIVPNVFERNYIWQCREITGPIDEQALNDRLQRFTGEQDFRAFSRYTGKKSTVRSIYEVSAVRLGGEVRITFRGSGFLYNQVRLMVGWALTGERYTAPARGLCLQHIEYGEGNL